MTMTKFLKQTSVQAFLPFLLVPLVVTTETQGHEVSKAKNIKTETFWLGPGDQNDQGYHHGNRYPKKKSTICDSRHIGTLKLFLKYTCCLLEGRMIVLKKISLLSYSSASKLTNFFPLFFETCLHYSHSALETKTKFFVTKPHDLSVTHRGPSSHHAQCLVLHTPHLWESAL